ncbi:hypothetical protein BH11ARM1_BH11ARM1_17470 [soil metagenome]
MSENESQPKTPLSVYDLLPFFIEQTASVAWQKLGLQHDPVTGALDQDLTQARVAIDVVAFMASQLETQLDEADKRQLQTMVRDLRINFVQKSGA